MRLACLAILVSIIGALTLPGCGNPLQPQLREQLERAQQAFDHAKSKDDFLRVAAMYQQIVEMDIHSGAIFYNQGNAYARAGERGRAIACYRQAKRYRPNDPLLDANLRSALRTSSSGAAQKPLIEYVLFWQNWISYPAKFRLTLGLAGVCLLLGMLSLAWSNPLLQKLSLIALLITLAAGFSSLYDWYRFEQWQHGGTNPLRQAKSPPHLDIETPSYRLRRSWEVLANKSLQRIGLDQRHLGDRQAPHWDYGRPNSFHQKLPESLYLLQGNRFVVSY